MTATSIWWYLFPLYVLGGLLLVVGTFALLGRIQGGRLPAADRHGADEGAAGRQGDAKMSQAALERQNPELASAVESSSAPASPRIPTRAAGPLASLRV